MNQQTIDPIKARAFFAELLATTQPAAPFGAIRNLMRGGGLDIEPPSTLRFHPALPYLTETGACLGEFPALVLPLQSSAGEVVGLETAYLGPHGLADVPVPYQHHDAGKGAGAFFSVDERLTPAIGVAVGFSSAIAARAILRLPVSLCAVQTPGDLAAFDWPKGSEAIAVFCDVNTMGEASALAERAQQAGLEAQVFPAPTPGATWLQELALAGAVPVDEVAAEKANDTAAISFNDDE